MATGVDGHNISIFSLELLENLAHQFIYENMNKFEHNFLMQITILINLTMSIKILGTFNIIELN